MQDLEAIAARLDRMESVKAVADLVHGYAQAVARGDGAAVAPLFADDGAFIVLETGPDGAVKPRSELRGAEALNKFYVETIKPGDIYPLVSDLMVEVDGDTATSTCLMGGAARNGVPQFFGHYLDTCRRDNGKWRFASRTFTIISWSR